MKKTAKPPAGRPARHQGERLSKNRTFRVRGQLDEQLSAAADQSGRSVSEEIEFRLDRTFSEERSFLDVLDHVYGPENVALLTSMGEIIKSIAFWAPAMALARSKNQHPDANWLDDPFLFEEIVKALNAFLGALRPSGPPVPPKNYEATLHEIGPRSAKAILALIAGTAAPTVDLEKSGWAGRTRAKLSKSTAFKILEANSQNTDGAS